MRLLLAILIIGIVWINAIYILLSNGGNDKVPGIKSFLERIENLFTFRKIMDPYNPRILWTPSTPNNYFLFMRTYKETVVENDSSDSDGVAKEKLLLGNVSKSKNKKKH